jgi:two-component system, LuxR family, response regulator FixJ
MASDPIVHVVDDDDAVRKSVSFLLMAEGFNVRQHESALTFLKMKHIDGGCIVTDVRMPEVSGIEFIRLLKERGSSLPVIVMTGHADISLAVEAMNAGAVDFLEKPFEDERFLEIVRSALLLREHTVQQAEELQAIRMRLDALSMRERQVVDCLIAGKANKVIAHDLSISPRTVEIYRANVMTKMEAKSLSELVRMVLVAERSV